MEWTASKEDEAEGEGTGSVYAYNPSPMFLVPKGVLREAACGCSVMDVAFLAGAAPEKKGERLRRERTAGSMADYGLLGSAHMLFSLPEAEWYDEWTDTDDEDAAPSLPHVLSAAAEAKGRAQKAYCVTIPTGDEERWLQLPPLPYLRHGAADHMLTRYVEVLGVVCGEKAAPLLAPMAQPGPLPLAPRPQLQAPPQRTTTDPDVWEACKLSGTPRGSVSTKS